MEWVDDLIKHLDRLGIAILAISAVAVTAAGRFALAYSKIRAALRDESAGRALAEQAAADSRLALEGVVESVDKAVAHPDLAPETQRLIKAKLKATQVELGVQSDVQEVVEAVRRKGETPETGVKVPPPAPLG